MSVPNFIMRYDPDSRNELWEPTTLDQINKKEKFLEKIITETPQLLGLENKTNGIYGPFYFFRQLSFVTPNKRQIHPDIVILSASGHIVIVEVKRSSNPELKDRRVLAQLIDYAGSFSALEEEQIVAIFNNEYPDIESWVELIHQFFPEEVNYDELAQLILQRLKLGDLNLIIACDKLPIGLNELIKGIASQSALEFKLEVAEIVPYIQKQSQKNEIIFVPQTRLRTEIVARTAVTVIYRQKDLPPSVEIQTSSIDEIEENVRAVRRMSNSNGRAWSDEEIQENFANNDDPVLRKLFQFALKYSENGKVVAPCRKINPSFGFYVKGLKKNGSNGTYQIFRCTEGLGRAKIYLNLAEDISSEKSYKNFIEKLASIFKKNLNINQREPNIKLSAISKYLNEFMDVIIWFQEAVKKESAS